MSCQFHFFFLFEECAAVLKLGLIDGSLDWIRALAIFAVVAKKDGFQGYVQAIDVELSHNDGADYFKVGSFQLRFDTADPAEGGVQKRWVNFSVAYSGIT